MIRLPKPDELERVVEEHYREWGIGECIYDKCVEKLGKIDLDKLTEEDVKCVVRVFLVVWGQMARVLGRKDRRGWERRLADAIRSHADILERFRRMDLARISDEEFNELDTDIRSCYTAVRKVVGPTAASKTLHIIAPKFFPMWDAKIRKLYGVGDGEGGYVHFMRMLRELWLKNSLLAGSLEKLEEKLGKSKLRIIDMYNWLKSKTL